MTEKIGNKPCDEWKKSDNDQSYERKLEKIETAIYYRSSRQPGHSEPMPRSFGEQPLQQPRTFSEQQMPRRFVEQPLQQPRTFSEQQMSTRRFEEQPLQQPRTMPRTFREQPLRQPTTFSEQQMPRRFVEQPLQQPRTFSEQQMSTRRFEEQPLQQPRTFSEQQMSTRRFEEQPLQQPRTMPRTFREQPLQQPRTFEHFPSTVKEQPIQPLMTLKVANPFSSTSGKLSSGKSIEQLDKLSKAPVDKPIKSSQRTSEEQLTRPLDACLKQSLSRKSNEHLVKPLGTSKDKLFKPSPRTLDKPPVPPKRISDKHRGEPIEQLDKLSKAPVDKPIKSSQRTSEEQLTRPLDACLKQSLSRKSNEHLVKVLGTSKDKLFKPSPRTLDKPPVPPKRISDKHRGEPSQGPPHKDMAKLSSRKSKSIEQLPTSSGEQAVMSSTTSSSCKKPAKSLRKSESEEPAKSLLDQQIDSSSKSNENVSKSKSNSNELGASSADKDKVKTARTGNDDGNGQKKRRNRKRKSESEDFLKRTTPKFQMAILYVRINQHLSHQYDITDFIKERMGEACQFTVMKKDIVGTGTVITLKFQSKNQATRAANLLKQSNRESQTKLLCTMVKEEAFDISVEKDEGQLKKQLEQILKRAKRTTDNHDEKIELANLKIKSLSTNKHVSLEEFEQKQHEKFALKDKLEELTGQQKQFQTFLSSLCKKLRQTWEENTFAKHISDLRKEFGVECCRLENALPMYARRNDILTLVKENQVSVILGETGSGKSTQMTQYLHQAGYSQSGIIVCTQPRKVAAISLATHVASELATSVGNVVGYKVGMRAKTSGVTKILYMTDHCLLNECLKDPSLSAYSCVIVDEAHERSIYTDLLLGMLKICLNQRPELKAIITSATIDPDVFVRYFGACPVLRVSGRMFPVEVVYQGADEGEKSYIDSALIKVEKVHKEEPPGDVLVFVTSPLETEQCSERLKARLQGRTDFKCLILHGQVQPEEQQMVFQPCVAGIRKIVFATNSAETSITIPGIKYVIDTGFVKEKRYDPRRNMSSLSVVVISKSSADQRKGRAGRTGPGKCYRLYNEDLYKDMDTVAQPEILKVHLGQAMLKLTELGINPTQYEFVQSPGEAAIRAALETLEELGAVRDNKITEEGREMAKLPVEPRLGLIIQKGRAQGALFDAIVLAAISSMGSSVFFRGGSDDDKKKADKLKIQFCEKGGDSMTLMEVYRKWNKQPEKKKNSWCFENSINSKSIRIVRETVNEITTVMKKDFKMKIEHVLQEPEVVDEKLQKILFESYVSNICHYLGHIKAGYIASKLDQQVHPHPSSVLNPLNLKPEWLVFEQSLKTSKDFITGLTPVKEDWVVEAIESGRLKANLDEMRNKKLVAVHTEYVGSNIFRMIVGPQYTKLRALGDKASDLVKPALAIIEASRDRGELKVLSSEHTTDKLGQLFTPIVSQVRETMINDDVEIPLSQKNENAGIRVVLGKGGQVKDLLMPEEFRTVFVDKPSEISSEDTIIAKFCRYGEIKNHRMFKNPMKRWGCITFESASDAALAVQATKEDESEVAVPERRGRGYQNSDFRVKITWCRRESRGFGYVEVDPEDLPRILRCGVINIKGSMVHLVIARNNERSLYLKNFGKDVNEDDIKSAFSKLVGEVNIRKVTVVREKIGENKENMEEIGNELMALIEESVPKERFRLDVKQPRNLGTAMHLAFANFTNADEGIAACQRISKRSYIRNKVVTMEPQIQSSIFINPEVYVAVRDDLEAYLKEYKDFVFSEVAITSKNLKNGTVILNIESSNTMELAKVRASLQEIIQGDVLECGTNPYLRHFFTGSGRDFLKDVEKKCNAYIQADYRNLTISIRGKQGSITRARSELNEYLNSIVNAEWKEVNLRGNAMPNGVMKTLMNEYGLELEKLQQKTGLRSLTLNFKQQMVKMIGSFEAIAKTVAVIDKVCASLQDGLKKATEEEDLPDCTVCFCPIEEKDIYRLEYCGHAYCSDCVKRQVECQLKDKEIPILCGQQECGKPFMWRDLTFLARQGSFTINSIAQSSVSSYVIANSKDIKYCLTPDCNMVYKVTTTGAVFRCPECTMKICTSCHTQYHEGLTCAMFKSAKEDEGNLDVYLASRTNVKKCPNCTQAIEKTEGCNHMHCEACKCSFCWICLAHFKTSDACYNHLSQKHGGCF